MIKLLLEDGFKWALPILLLTACGRPAATSAPKEIWNADNDPLLLSGNFNRTFDSLPRSAHLPTKPWVDTYWPSNFGGLAARWDSDPSRNFSYKSPTREQVANMTLSERARLSPAEKYDIYKGRYDYPTVASERQRTNPRDKDWEGLCHGWAAAALDFKEPKPFQITSADGLEVPFGASDVKGLLSYYQGEVSDAPAQMLGTRCDIDLTKHPDAVRTHPECKGINAGSFHVALVNLVAAKTGFVADISHGNEIWNQPVFGFSSRLITMQRPSLGAAEGTVREAVLRTQMSYMEETDGSWDTLADTDAATPVQINYDYRVELDGDGDIIGGAWLSAALPDFIWTQERPTFEGYYGDIQTIYDKSLQGPELVLDDPPSQPHPLGHPPRS